MMYEERRVTLLPGALSDYLGVCKESVWPVLESAGGSVLCLLAGLIGDPSEHVLQFTHFQGISAWEQAQRQLMDINRSEWVAREQARLLRPIASRPKPTVVEEDYRPVYGYRRFFVRPRHLGEFARCSEEGIWPRMERLDARILGLWTTVVATDPIEVVLLTGYRGPTHWEDTRLHNPRPEVFDTGVWERARTLGAQRISLTLETWVCLMRLVYPYGVDSQ